jgi:hypothetical protein
MREIKRVYDKNEIKTKTWKKNKRKQINTKQQTVKAAHE